MKFKAPIEVESSLVDSSNSSGSAGQVLTSTGVGVDWIDPTLLPAESAEKVIQTVRFGEAVSKGDPLVITGYHGSTGPAIVERADATDATKMPAYGVALEDYANNATGLMIAAGDFNDFDTSSYSVGDTLYVAVGGGMTNVKPTGTALIQNMGIVSRSNANNGDVEIVAIGRTNDVPNLPTGRLFVGTATNTSLISDVVYVDDANDRVGIGTTSPAAKLDVRSSLPVLRLTDTREVSTISAPIGVIEFFSEDASGNYPSVGASIQAINLSSLGSATGLSFFTNTDSVSPSEKMRITNAGNVGIGTTSPAYKLDVNGSLHSTSLNIADAIYHEGDTNTYIQFVANDTIRLVTSGLERMRLNSSGNVGIGTSSPSAKLHLLQSSTSNTADLFSIQHNFLFGSLIYTANDFVVKSTGNVGINTTSPGYKLDVRGTLYSSNITIADKVIHEGDTNTYMTFPSNDTISWYTSGGERMRIDSVGNVGIGTTSPPSKVSISGGTLSVSGSGSGFGVVKLGDPTDANPYVGMYRSAAASIATSGNFLNLGGYDGIAFTTGAAQLSGQPERMRITSSGNVGIGTTTPASLLAVGGSGEAAVFSVEGISGISTIATFRDIDGENVFLTAGKISDSSIDITFGDVNSAYGLPYYTINSDYHSFMDGNVGIGTSSPGAKLEVSGDLIVVDSTSYLVVDSTGVNAQGYDVGGQNSGLELQDSVAKIGLDLSDKFVGLNVQTGLGAWLENENAYKFGIAPALDELTSTGLVQTTDTPNNDSRVEGWIKIYDESSGQMYFMPVYL